MKKTLLVGMLLSGIQTMAMDGDDMRNLVKVAQCCIVGCEGVRALIRTDRVSYIPKSEQFDGIRKSLTCFNVSTVCAVGCCALGQPVAACLGVGCSVIGCCIDESLFSNNTKLSVAENSITLSHCHGSFHSTNYLDQLDKKNRKSSEDEIK